MSRERLQRLFRGNDTWYGQYKTDPETGEKVNAFTKAGPVPDEAWDRHVTGEDLTYGMGVVPINDNDTCYWGCIDLDDDDTDHAALVLKIRRLGLPFEVCRSKSGGAHLFLFFIEPINPVKLIAKLKRWSILLDLKNPPDEKGRPQPLEIFPKQVSLGDGQKGSWLNMPYFGGNNTNRYGVSDKGKPMKMRAWLKQAEERRLTDLELEAATRHESVPVSSPDFFLDGPPCLQALHDGGFGEGTRNNGLTAVGIFMKLKYPDDWDDRLEDYNLNSGAIQPPLDEDEVRTIIQSLNRKGYSYKCNDTPINGHCSKGKCKTMEFGVDRFRQDRNKDHMQPRLGQLLEFKNGTGDPPMYELEMDGKSIVFKWDEILLQTKFKMVCFRDIQVLLPPMKQHEWEIMLSDLLEEKIIIPVPSDAGPHGQFRVHLAAFLKLRTKSDGIEDVVQGKPWENKGRVYFRSGSLIEHLERRKFRDMNTGVSTWNAIRKEGGGFTTLTVLGEQVQVWWLAVPDNEQTEDFTEKANDGPEF